MIVYQSSKENFLKDVANKNIEDIVLEQVKNKLHINVGGNEINSWKNSLREMYFILDDQTVYEENIQLNPCAYMHNYVDDGIITNLFYSDYIAKAPVFLKNDKEKLKDFIKKFV